MSSVIAYSDLSRSTPRYRTDCLAATCVSQPLTLNSELMRSAVPCGWMESLYYQPSIHWGKRVHYSLYSISHIFLADTKRVICIQNKSTRNLSKLYIASWFEVGGIYCFYLKTSIKWGFQGLRDQRVKNNTKWPTRKHDTLTHCLSDVGTTSHTLGQH